MHAQLGLPDKGRAIKGLVVCNDEDLEPLDRLNGLAIQIYSGIVFVIVDYTNIYHKMSFSS